MAYRTDGTANFNFFINRQGPRGPQGIQGPDGFSPNIQVEEDQGNTFTLRITNKDNFFITSNLREHKEDRGGDYIRYDRAGQLMYVGDPDFATTVKAGEVRLSTVDDLTAGSDTVALTPKVYKDDITNVKSEIQGDIATVNSKIDATNENVSDISNKVTKLDNNTVKLDNEQMISGPKTFSSETIFPVGLNTSFVNDANGGFALQLGFGEIRTHTPIRDESSNTFYLNQSSITAGDNTVVEKTSNGIKISSTAQGDVTLGGDNSFTGNNTFDGESTFNGYTWTLNQEAENLTVNNSATFKNIYATGTLSSVGEISAVSINTAGIKNNQNNKYYLTQASITAGNNVTIEETTDGVKINSTDTKYTLPVASSTTLGGIKVGDNLSIAEDGTLSATSGGSSEPPANMVTTDTEQSITGAKTFDKIIFKNDWNKGIFINDLAEPSMYAIGDSFHLKNVGELTGVGGNLVLGDNDQNTFIYGKTVIDKNDKMFLVQGSVTAGSDNLVISDTADGIQITCNAPTNAQFGQLLELIADLSTKINNLTDRVRALEEQIDGGNADSEK